MRLRVDLGAYDENIGCGKVGKHKKKNEVKLLYRSVRTRSLLMPIEWEVWSTYNSIRIAEEVAGKHRVKYKAFEFKVDV